MKAYANGYNYKDDSAFVVIIDGEKHIYRLNKMTGNMCELLAFKFTMLGTSREQKVSYYTNCKYLEQILEQEKDAEGNEIAGKFVRKPSNNVAVIEEIRALKRANVKVIFDNDSKEITSAKRLTRLAIGRTYEEN